MKLFNLNHKATDLENKHLTQQPGMMELNEQDLASVNGAYRSSDDYYDDDYDWSHHRHYRRHHHRHSGSEVVDIIIINNF